MSMEEREDRMGELPKYLFDERGGYPKQAPIPSYQPGQQVPPDIGYQGELKEQVINRGEPGNIPIPWGTDPIYSVLPPNADQFNFIIEFTGSDNGNFQTIFNRTTPEGRVYVVREVQIQMVDGNAGFPVPPGSLDNIDGSLVTFFKNGSPDPENQQMPFWGLNQSYHLYTIIGGAETFSIQMNIQQMAGFEEIVLLVRVSGDDLQTNKYPDLYNPNLKGANVGI